MSFEWHNWHIAPNDLLLYINFLVWCFDFVAWLEIFFEIEGTFWFLSEAVKSRSSLYNEEFLPLVTQLFELFVIFWHPLPQVLPWECKCFLFGFVNQTCTNDILYFFTILYAIWNNLWKFLNIVCSASCIFILLAFYLVYLSTICLTLYFIICMLYYCKFFLFSNCFNMVNFNLVEDVLKSFCKKYNAEGFQHK